jgi:hypothetical protein
MLGGRKMTAEERLETALHSADPVPALRAEVEGLARQGANRTEIYETLEKLLLRLRSRPAFDEREEEALLDVMDALTGWCHPSAELLPEKPAKPSIHFSSDAHS